MTNVKRKKMRRRAAVIPEVSEEQKFQQVLGDLGWYTEELKENPAMLRRLRDLRELADLVWRGRRRAADISDPPDGPRARKQYLSGVRGTLYTFEAALNRQIRSFLGYRDPMSSELCDAADNRMIRLIRVVGDLVDHQLDGRPLDSGQQWSTLVMSQYLRFVGNDEGEEEEEQ